MNGNGQSWLFYKWVFSYSSIICWNPFPTGLFWHFCQKSIMCRFIWGLSMLFNWSVCLPFCQYHTTMIPVALWYVSESGSMNPHIFSFPKIRMSKMVPDTIHSLYPIHFNLWNMVFQRYHPQKRQLYLCCLKNILY